MLNEIQEFLDYTTPVTYTAKAKADTTYLRHFTLDFFTSFDGLNRVLTMIARGIYSRMASRMLTGRSGHFLPGAASRKAKKPLPNRSGNTEQISGSYMRNSRNW